MLARHTTTKHALHDLDSVMKHGNTNHDTGNTTTTTSRSRLSSSSSAAAAAAAKEKAVAVDACFHESISASISSLLVEGGGGGGGDKDNDDSNSSSASSSRERKEADAEESIKEAFRRRLGTFSTMTFFGKPLCLSPMVCARYGWINRGRDMLHCEECQEALCVELFHPEVTMSNSKNAQEELVQFYRDKLSTAHAMSCRWYRRASLISINNIGPLWKEKEDHHDDDDDGDDYLSLLLVPVLPDWFQRLISLPCTRSGALATWTILRDRAREIETGLLLSTHGGRTASNTANGPLLQLLPNKNNNNYWWVELPDVVQASFKKKETKDDNSNDDDDDDDDDDDSVNVWDRILHAINHTDDTTTDIVLTNEETNRAKKKVVCSIEACVLALFGWSLVAAAADENKTSPQKNPCVCCELCLVNVPLRPKPQQTTVAPRTSNSVRPAEEVTEKKEEEKEEPLPFQSPLKRQRRIIEERGMRMHPIQSHRYYCPIVAAAGTGASLLLLKSSDKKQAVERPPKWKSILTRLLQAQEELAHYHETKKPNANVGREALYQIRQILRSGLM